MCKYFIYGNDGCIDDVIDGLQNNYGLRFSTLYDVFDYVEKHSMFIKKDDLSLKYYCYDSRINKRVFMICTNRCGKENYIKKYGHSCFAGYFLVEL